MSTVVNQHRCWNSLQRRDEMLRRAAFTLIELMIVVAIISIMAGMLISNLASTSYDQVVAAAQIIEAELGYARNLAMANASQYRVTFNAARNQFVLTHSGTNTALDNLPSSPFRNPTDPANQQITNLGDLPRLQEPVTLFGAYRVATGDPSVANIEFGPLGNVTSTTDPVVIYLSAGNGDGAIYISLDVNPVTGLVTVNTPTSAIKVTSGS